jgi:phytoene dehydrogenase-like protein
LKNISYEGSACKINLVLNDIPQLTCLPHLNEQARHAKSMEEKIRIYKNYLQGTIHINSESMQDIHTAYQDGERGEICRRPMIELVIPSILDASLNKKQDGNLVASMFVQYAPTKLAGGKEWDEASRAQFLKNTYDTIEEYAPGFAKSVVHADVLLPPDLERIFGLTGGNIFHGALSINNLFFSRPMPGFA